MKKTVVVGASPDEQRYSHRAVISLRKKGYEVVPVGFRKGLVDGLEIHTDFIPVDNVDTVSLYVNPDHQAYWQDYILSLKPRRVIFNPGSENPVLEQALRDEGIPYQDSCTLVMLSVGTY